MYGLSDIRKAIQNPRAALIELNRIWNQGPNFRSSPVVTEDGVDIMSSDWDKLIILDACRFDTFAELAQELPGQLEKRTSKSPTTMEFLRANFAGRELHDTVYVTANPQLYRAKNGINNFDPIDVSFHAQRDIWRDQWDEQHRTVMPEVVTNAALEAAEDYPRKRLIVHYLQPHAPYIGPTGRQKLPTDKLDFWNGFREGEFEMTLPVARRAYQENVELVLPHVAKLLSEFEGKTIVTADHGELLGDRDSPIPLRRFGHPLSTELTPLVEVPWLVNERGTRPAITSEEPSSPDKDEIEADIVADRLRDLGYK